MVFIFLMAKKIFQWMVVNLCMHMCMRITDKKCLGNEMERMSDRYTLIIIYNMYTNTSWLKSIIKIPIFNSLKINNFQLT